MNSCRFCQLVHFCLTLNLAFNRFCDVSVFFFFFFCRLILLLLHRRQQQCHEINSFFYKIGKIDKYVCSHCFIASYAHFMHLFQFHEQSAHDGVVIIFIEVECFASCHSFSLFSSISVQPFQFNEALGCSFLFFLN